jgi:hypothetical protein
MLRFDAYTASVRGVGFRELCAIVDFEGSKVTGGRGYHGYGERISFRDAGGTEIASVSHGGTNAKTPMLEVTGERTPKIVPVFREAFPAHSCSRVDSAYDLEKTGAWDELLGEVLAVKAKHKLKGEQRGDWQDFPEDGRTMYLGAPTSTVRTRLYEKGKQPEYRALGHPDWVRLEIQVRPAKDAKSVYAGLTPEQVWGASRYTRDLAARVLQKDLDAFPAGTVWKETSEQQKRRAGARQYGPLFVRWLQQTGDIDTAFGRELQELIRTNKFHG